MCQSALNHTFQVFEITTCVLAVTLDDVKNTHGLPFEKSSEGTSGKARPHMSGQSRAADVGFNAPDDAFLNLEVEAPVTVLCHAFPGCRDIRYEAYDGTGSRSSDPSNALLECDICPNRDTFV